MSQCAALFVCSNSTTERNMESKAQYADNPPPTHAPPAPTPYYAPAPAAGPGPSGSQQYPQPPPQYPPQAQPFLGQVPYGQPPAGYPPGYGTFQYVGSPAAPPPQQQLQQQEQAVVVSAYVLVPRHQPTQSYVGAIVFACVVFWCCNLVFGLIAFILAG